MLEEGLDKMTISGHAMVMKTTRIAELKARLSHFVALARRGERVVVYDRDTPVAELLPFVKGPHRLTVGEPKAGGPKIHEVPLPPPLPLDIDIVAFLREDRERR